MSTTPTLNPRKPKDVNIDSILRQRKGAKRHSESQVRFPRLVKRDLPYHQSRNRVCVWNERHHSHVFPLLLLDWFHVFLRLPIWLSLSMLLVVWTVAILIFAGVYVHLDQQDIYADCGLGGPGTPIQWGTAFAFSLETCTTVGCKQFVACLFFRHGLFLA